MKHKVKALALTRGALVISSLSLLVLFAFFLAIGNAHAASTGYIKIEGVDGESTKSTVEPQTTDIQVTPYRPAPVEEANPTPGVEPDEIDYTDDDDDGEGLTPDTAVLLGGGSEEDRKVNDGYNWKVEEGTKILVNAAEVRGWNQEKKEELWSTTNLYFYAESEQDLKNFAQDVMLNDENIEEVQFTSKEIQVAYKASGKLLWIFPITFTEWVIAKDKGDQDPKIEIKLPWYKFFLSPDVNPDDIADEIKEFHSKATQVESWSFAVSTSGRSLQIITSILRTKHDTAKNSIGNVR